MARPDPSAGVPEFALADPEAAAEAVAWCFGCGPQNPRGLHLQAKHEGDTTIVEFQGSRSQSGWDTFYHGGILATLIDEVAAFAMFKGFRQFAMTRKMGVEYKRRVEWTRPLRAEARVRHRDSERVLVGCQLLQDGQVCTEGEVEFRLLKGPPPRGA